jgi:hypothetical protein
MVVVSNGYSTVPVGEGPGQLGICTSVAFPIVLLLILGLRSIAYAKAANTVTSRPLLGPTRPWCRRSCVRPVASASPTRSPCFAAMDRGRDDGV